MSPDPDSLDQDVRDALAMALNEKRLRITVKLTDRRLLLLYVLVIAAFIALGALVQARTSDRDGLIGACQDTRQNAVTLNKALDQLALSAQTSPILTRAERAQRAKFYDGLHQTVPTCPPGR
jgi:hypothetical protein